MENQTFDYGKSWRIPEDDSFEIGLGIMPSWCEFFGIISNLLFLWQVMENIEKSH